MHLQVTVVDGPMKELQQDETKIIFFVRNPSVLPVGDTVCRLTCCACTCHVYQETCHLMCFACVSRMTHLCLCLSSEVLRRAFACNLTYTLHYIYNNSVLCE